MRHVLSAALALSAMVVTGAALAMDPVGVDGVWRSEDGEALIEVAACASDPVAKCGTIVWLKKPLSANGKPQLDVKNADAALRKRLICGVEVVSAMKAGADGGYEGGTVYDPDEGKTYQGTMKLEGAGLKVTGFVETAVLGKISDSELWTRPKGSFEPCAAKK